MKTIFNCAVLKEKGYKLTPQRKVILEVLLSSSSHLSADEIYFKAKGKDPSLGLTTVYRTLEILKEVGLVKKYDFGDGKARYELEESRKTYGHHHHLVCISCNKVIDYVDFVEEEMQLIKRAEKHVERKYGFLVKGHLIQLYGICKSCRDKSKREGRRG